MTRYIGMDVHREFVQLAVVEDGIVRDEGKIGVTPEALRTWSSELRPDDEVALEATGNSDAIATLLTPLVSRVVVSNPSKTRAIAEAKVKTDKVDARILAQLLAADFLPPVWLPDDRTRSLRRQVMRRAHVVRQRTRLKNQWTRNKWVYGMFVPVLIYYLLFHYGPMYGAIIAFKDFTPAGGILHSPWVGTEWFREFFKSFYFSRLIRNTLLISVYSIVFGFPIPIIFALLLNELHNRIFQRTVQTVTYLPHFISTVVVVGMIFIFTARTGPVNDLVEALGGQRLAFMAEPGWFRPLYVGSDVWQRFGWNSIIYLAALTGIDPGLYEAATIDGASRWQQRVHITLPGIAPTIIILLILRMGRLMTVGFEKIILMYNPMTYETADVISTFVYRQGLLEMNYSYSAAVGLFNSLINFAFLLAVNRLSRRISRTSLW